MIDSNKDLLTLVENLNTAQRLLVEATGGKVDAVLLPMGGLVLLPEAQQQLRNSEAEHRQFAAEKAAILDALPAHVALLDVDGKILTINQAWRDFSLANGFSGTDFGVGMDYLSACEAATGVDAALVATVVDNLRGVLEGASKRFSVEYSCDTSRERRWFQLLASPMPRGSVYGAVVMHVDIGERKQAEALTHKIKIQLETLVSEATVGIVVHDNWKLIMANDELARMFGFSSREEILTVADLRTLYAPEEFVRLVDYFEARASGKAAPKHYEAKAKKRDGTLIDVENHVFLLDWDDRTVVCAMITDVTEQRDTAAQLRQLQKMDAIGQLTGGIAHDFNNILMVILANSDAMLEEEELSPAIRRGLERIGKSAEGAADLTRSLLAFSRKLPLRPQSTDINDLVVNVSGMLRRTLGAQIEINSVLGDGLWPISIDRAQLESALVNLCINARDAMPLGGQLFIETTNTLRNVDGAENLPGSYVGLTVTDTGTGIAPELLAKVFEPFFTTKEVGKGTGLGLSMVYGFIKQSGGHIDVSSELGVGTTIKMYFPRAEQAKVVAARSVLATPRGTERILVVEDDPQVRASVVGQLRSLGYFVDEAADGAAGLVVFEGAATPYDLLVTDIIMPGPLSCMELIAAVRHRRPETCILFMSGYASDAIVYGGHLDPEVQLLSKPFRKSDLATAVRSQLDLRVSSPSSLKHSSNGRPTVG